MKISLKDLINLPRTKTIRSDEDEAYSYADAAPGKYSKYLIDLNNLLYFNDVNVYRGREKEIEQIFNSLLKTSNPNVVLLGENGVGKSAIVNLMVYKVLEKECPEKLKYDHFFYLNVERIIAELGSESIKTSKKLDSILEGIYKYLTAATNTILVIDQIHLMALSTFLSYYLTIFLNSHNVKIIGMSTPEEFYTYFSYDPKILSKLDIVDVLEPKPKKIYPMISEYVKLFEQRHDVKISENMINYTVSVSTAFDSEMCNPGLTLNFIEKSMIYAKSNNRREVTKADVNSNFNFDYELYEEMTPEDKRITAFHEAGHFVVSRLSDNIKNYRTTAITIIPSDYFLGITLFEFEPEKQSSLDVDYFIDSIAVDLGGRVAESFLNQDGQERFTSGASSDLREATQTARNIIAKYGMIETSKNVRYFCSYDRYDIALLSEDRKRIIDEETHELINKAYDRANEILTNNKELLARIANELLQNEVLDYTDLERICSEYIKTE